MLPIREYLQFRILPSDPQRAKKLKIKAPQYRMIDDKLYHRSYLSPWLRCVGPIQAKGIIHEIHQGSSNGQVEVTNHDIVKGMERRSGKTHQGWMSYNSLVYGLEAIVPIEISVETQRIKEFKVRENKKRRREDLDILEEQREIASIREAYYKHKLEGYYNKHVRPSSFKPVGAYKLETLSGSPVDRTWNGSNLRTDI
ncbi:hypothetical protein Tco_1077418 [Tanacetum coccineum]